MRLEGLKERKEGKGEEEEEEEERRRKEVSIDESLRLRSKI